MHMLSMLLLRRRGARPFFGLLAWLLAAGMLWPTLASAQTSAYCPAPLTATITSGGSHTFDVSSCDGWFDTGMSDGPPATPPAHGSYVIGPNTGGSQSVTYTHNGDSATSDSFTLLDMDNGFVTFDITITAAASPITVSPSSLPTMTAGTTFSQALSSSGGIGPYTYTLQSGTLPPGITLSGNTLSGTPTQRGGYNFTIRSTDSKAPTPDFFDKTYIGTVQNPTLSLVANSGTAIQGVAFSQTLSTSGGVAPYSYQLETGSFPAGISFSSTGVVSGTTTAAPGNYPVTIRVTDGSTGPGSYFELENYTLTVSAQPGLSINDVSVSEGNAGTTNATFTVSLSAPAGPGGVSFDIATVNGTATAASSDYTAQSLTGQTIPAGSSTYTFTVTVYGDTLHEPNETFIVNVTNVTNAVVDDGLGTGTILNDDLPPSLSIGDATVVEGAAGSTNAIFTVTLGAASGQTVSVNYATADGTATQPADYTATSGTLTFPPGQTTRTISVPVVGETMPEANESFFVNLSGAVNATISDNQGVGTITNDDVPVSVSPVALPGGAVATAYSQTVTASGGSAPYTYAITAGAPPVGLSLSPAGVLSGTPTAGGTFNFTITATDSNPFPGPFSGSQAYSVTIASPTIVLSATTLAGGSLGTAYSASISPASGGTAPYSYSVTAGALPDGLTLATGTGAITGTPSATGTFNFSITATDSSAGTGPYAATRTYAITVVDIPPVANPVSATVAYDSSGNPITLNITGGAATSVAIGTAPTLGTATASGTTITYTPTAGYVGPDSFTYTATNAGGTSAPATVSVTVQDPVVTITAAGGFAATVAAPYTQTFTFNGGAQPWSAYQVTSLPAGITITATTANSVTVSGAPTQAGTFILNVSATDSSTGSGPYTVWQVFALTVGSPTLALAPASATFNPAYGAPYSQTFTASGGTGSYVYTATGSLPPGVTLSGDTLSGTPTATGSYGFSVTATDIGTTGTGAPFAVTGNYTINVAAPTIVVAPASLPSPSTGTAYGQTISASGGVAPYSFAVTAGALPSGLTLAPNGSLSGTSSTVGTFNFTVTATDANTQTGSRTYTLTTTAPVLDMTPAAGTLNAPYGAAYSQAFTASGGSGNFNYVLAGALPAGLSFSGNTVSGTPVAPGSYPVTITATDTTLTGAGAPFSIAQNYTINVPAPAITVDPATLPGTTAGLAYNQAISASGGAAPYTFAVTAGALPAGLTLGGDGTLTGTTTASGTFNFTVTAADHNGQTGSRAYAVVVAVPTLMVTPATLPSGIAGSAYGQTLTISGGIAPYTVVASGTLPSGISFDAATLTYSGTPTQSGTFHISVTATDSTGGTAATVTNSYALTIAAPTLTLTPATVTTGTAGTAYSQAFSASGGIAPYTYAVSAGALPAGLSLTPAGALSGTPTVAGNFGFSVTATDSTSGAAGSVTQAYTLEVSAPTITLTPETLPAGTFMVGYAQQLTATGGTAPYRYAVTAGALPAGMTLGQDGQLSGKPAAAGAFAFTVTATDALGFFGNRAYALAVEQRPDPSQDPEVRGLINAQAEAARRFATSQIGNFQQRMQRLHGHGTASGFSNSLSVATRQACVPGTDIAPGNNRCDLQRQQPFDAGGSVMSDGGHANAATSSNVPTTFGVWAAGMLRSGSLDSRGGSAELAFETDGVSAGADYRINHRVALGMGVGYGRDRTHVGENGSRSDARAYTFAAYASVNPAERFFVDTLLGYQTLDFDLLRHVAANDGRATGSRSGSQWLGSVSAGMDLAFRDLQVTPYLRMDVARGELDGYAEQADAPNALAYGKMDVASTTGNAGIRFDWRRQTTWGSFSPQLKAEYQHDFSGDGTATLQYGDLLQMPSYRTRLDGHARSRWLLGAGLQFNWGTGWGLRVDYRTQMGDAASDHGVEFHLDARF